MKFTKRIVAPSTNDKNWIHISKGGYNRCIERKNGSVLPNCTGYVWGRWRELLGVSHKLSTFQAEIWYTTNDGYSRGQTPKLGAVICWSKGSAKTTSDGSGHVAVVEEVYSDGSILISQSGYSGTRFWTQKLKPPYKFGTNYHFQGFIYLPLEFDDTNSNIEWITGSYKLLVSKAIRTRHDLGDNVVRVGRCMSSVRPNLTSNCPDDEAKYKVGTVVNITEIYIDIDNRIWGKLQNCWIVLCNKDGTPQATKI